MLPRLILVRLLISHAELEHLGVLFVVLFHLYWDVFGVQQNVERRRIIQVDFVVEYHDILLISYLQRHLMRKYREDLSFAVLAHYRLDYDVGAVEVSQADRIALQLVIDSVLVALPIQDVVAQCIVENQLYFQLRNLRLIIQSFFGLEHLLRNKAKVDSAVVLQCRPLEQLDWTDLEQLT